jgi:hypothetical protein
MAYEAPISAPNPNAVKNVIGANQAAKTPKATRQTISTSLSHRGCALCDLQHDSGAGLLIKFTFKAVDTMVSSLVCLLFHLPWKNVRILIKVK